MNDLWTSEVIVKLNGNFNVVRPVYIFPNLWYCYFAAESNRLLITAICFIPEVPLVFRQAQAKFGIHMGPHGTDRTQVGPMFAPSTLLSGMSRTKYEKSYHLLIVVLRLIRFLVVRSVCTGQHIHESIFQKRSENEDHAHRHPHVHGLGVGYLWMNGGDCRY